MVDVCDFTDLCWKCREGSLDCLSDQLRSWGVSWGVWRWLLVMSVFIGEGDDSTCVYADVSVFIGTALETNCKSRHEPFLGHTPVLKRRAIQIDSHCCLTMLRLVSKK